VPFGGWVKIPACGSLCFNELVLFSTTEDTDLH
ncbi:MAG: hypothetical protein ACI92G_003955, partial [Candidatus Pelagisphaera sp.]